MAIIIIKGKAARGCIRFVPVQHPEHAIQGANQWVSINGWLLRDKDRKGL